MAGISIQNLKSKIQNWKVANDDPDNFDTSVARRSPRRPVAPHPRGRLSRRHGSGEEPRLLSVRRPQRPPDTRPVRQLRDLPHRLQPSGDARPGVPATASRGCSHQTGQQRYLHGRVRGVRRDLHPPGSARVSRRAHLLRRGWRRGGGERVENGVRLESAQEHRARSGREGEEGPPLPQRLSRAHRLLPLPHEHGRRPRKNRSKARSGKPAPSPKATSRPSFSSRSRERGGTTTSAPSFSAACALWPTSSNFS